MPEIPDIRSRNFTLKEIIHRGSNVSQEIILIGMYRLGYMQGFRDWLWHREGKEIRITITSGWRDLDYNRSIGSSDGSYHIWKLDDKNVIFSANDFKSPDMDHHLLCERFAEFCRGEVYKHNTWKFVHGSDYGVDETFALGASSADIMSA